MPRVVSGALTGVNRGAIDWGYDGLIAYGSHASVVIVHPETAEVIQTLEGHKSNVVKVKWARQNHAHNYRKPSMRLASGESNGYIVVWDVVSAVQRCAFTDSANPVSDMAWLSWQDASPHFLLALHPPYSLILWNGDTGEKIWKKSYTDRLSSLTLDPFSPSHLAFLTAAGNLMMIDDFNVNKVPSSNGQLFRINGSLASSASSSSLSGDVNGGNKRSSPAEGVLSRGAKLINRPMTNLMKVVTNTDRAKADEGDIRVGGGGGGSGSGVGGGEAGSFGGGCMQICYSPSSRHILYMVWAREVMVLDTEVLQSIAHVVLDRNMSPFLQVTPCFSREAVYFIQEHGCVTLRLFNLKPNSSHSELSYLPVEVSLDAQCSSDSLRVTKSYRVFGASVCPVSERKICLLMSTGRLIIYDLVANNSRDIPEYYGLSDVIKVDKNTLAMSPQSKLRFIMNGMVGSLGNSPTVVKWRPANDPNCDSNVSWGRLAAVGTSDGSIQLVDMETGQIRKDLAVHSAPIRCLEWAGANHVVSSGYCQTLTTSSLVKNELFITDIRTGLSKVLRPDTDESPVEIIAVSYYFTYLAISFRDQPMEIWHLKDLRLLRRMSKSCPVIVDMAWSGKHHQARIVKSSVSSIQDIVDIAEVTGEKKEQTVYRENLVVLDNENHLYHVVVKGMHVRDGKEVNTQWQSGSQINGMVWKGDYLAFGDSEGKVSGVLKRLFIEFPLKLLVQESLKKSIVNARAPSSKDQPFYDSQNDVRKYRPHPFTLIHSISVPNGLHVPIVDVDICGNPIVITSDGALRMFDPTLTTQSQPVHDEVITSCFCPCILPISTLAAMKIMMRNLSSMRRIYPETANTAEQTSAGPAQTISQIVSQTELMDSDKELINAQLAVMNEQFKDMEKRLWTMSDCDRGLSVGKLLGDEWEFRFWSVAKSILASHHEPRAATDDQPLSPAFDWYWAKSIFQQYQKLRCGCLEPHRGTGNEPTENCIERLIAVGEKNGAVQMLLESPNPTYEDSLLACLLASLSSNPPDSSTQSTVKLVATNLIAAGKLSEGTQLLCLINKSFDACRYLQSNGQWEKAAWLAKISLNEEDSWEILKKWVDHICSPNLALKSLGCLLLLSLGEYNGVIEILLSQKQVGLATLLIELIEDGADGGRRTSSSASPSKLVELAAENSPPTPPTNSSTPNSSASTKYKISEKLRQNVLAEFARELQTYSLNKAALYYADKAGGQFGEAIKKEIAILAQESIGRTSI